MHLKWISYENALVMLIRTDQYKNSPIYLKHPIILWQSGIFCFFCKYIKTCIRSVWDDKLLYSRRKSKDRLWMRKNFKMVFFDERKCSSFNTSNGFSFYLRNFWLTYIEKMLFKSCIKFLVAVFILKILAGILLCIMIKCTIESL